MPDIADRRADMGRRRAGVPAGHQVVRAEADTVRGAIAAVACRLAEAGVPDPRCDARLLVQHVLGIDRSGLLIAYDTALTAGQRARLRRTVDRRVAREPVSRIVGVREFWSLDFALSPAVLDPRPDSEVAVEAALSCVADRAAPVRVLDLGTGSGCLLLALLHALPAGWGVGVDIDPRAIAVARDNAGRLGLEARAAFLCGDWATALTGGFDLVVANPPYVRRAELSGLEPEVAIHDPPIALDGGADGLAAYRRLLTGIGAVLPAGSRVVLEVGAGQAGAVSDLLRAHGLVEMGRLRDLSGIERCVIGEKVFGMRSQSG